MSHRLSDVYLLAGMEDIVPKVGRKGTLGEEYGRQMELGASVKRA